MEPVVWTAHPAKERPRDVALVLCVLFLTLGATLVSFNSLFLTLLAGTILIIGLGSFLFPTHYSLNEWGVEAQGMLRKRGRRWRELRRYQIGPGAVLVSPFAQPTWLDRYRGMILQLAGADREKVSAMLESQLGPNNTRIDDIDDEEE